MTCASEAPNPPPPVPHHLTQVCDMVDNEVSGDAGTKGIDCFTKYVAFYKNFFNATIVDKEGMVESGKPVRLSTGFKECLKGSHTFAQHTQNIGDNSWPLSTRSRRPNTTRSS